MGIIPSSPGVYKITCTANHKVYIGSTTEIRKRWSWHRSDLRRGIHHNRHLQFAWSKYGKQAFTFEILEMVMFAEHLHEREQYWLDHYRAYDPKLGFNIGKVARAPWLGRAHSEETKQKLSDKARQSGTIKHAQPFAAEWHGSKAGREWHRKHGQRVWQDRKPAAKICDHCGVAFETMSTHGRTRFCSNNCRAAARRAHHTDHEVRQCVGCGQPFSCNKYMPTQYCSGGCVAAHRPRDEQGQFT